MFLQFAPAFTRLHVPLRQPPSPHRLRLALTMPPKRKAETAAALRAEVKKRKAELELLREIFAEQHADRDLAAAAKLQAAAAQAEAAGAAQRIWNATLTSLTQSRRDLAGIPGVEEHVATIDAQIHEHLKTRPKPHDPTSAAVAPALTAAVARDRPQQPAAADIATATPPPSLPPLDGKGERERGARAKRERKKNTRKRDGQRE